jgi:hypothetical protein
MKLNDPLLGPVLSVLIYFLMVAIGFLVLTLPWSANAGAQSGAISGLAVLAGVAINTRGKMGDKDR